MERTVGRQLTIAVLLAVLGGCATVHQPAALPSSGMVHWDGGRAMMPADLAEQVSQVHRQLSDLAGLEVRLRIDGSPNINAFVHRDSVGGYAMVINAGMVDMIGYNTDELAFVIAHELGHVALQHLSHAQVDARQRQSKTVELVSMLADMVLPLSGLALSAGHAMQKAGFSREQEIDADQLGVALMRRAGFNPAGALTFQRKLLVVSNPSQLNLLSSHPPGGERIAALEAMLADQ